jgi:hypothetical protein
MRLNITKVKEILLTQKKQEVNNQNPTLVEFVINKSCKS